MLSDLIRKYIPDDENLMEKYGYVTLSEETGCLMYYAEEPKVESIKPPSEAAPVREDDEARLSEIADLNQENLQRLVTNWIDNDFEKIFIDPDYYKDPEGQETVYENDGLNQEIPNLFELSAKDESEVEYQNLHLLENATPDEALEPNDSIVPRVLET